MTSRRLGWAAHTAAVLVLGYLDARISVAVSLIAFIALGFIELRQSRRN